MPLLALLAALLLPARAGELESWKVLHDARLVMALDARPEEAAHELELLLRELGPGAPLRAEVAYWLAHARLARGDADGAREALEIASRQPELRDAVRSFSDQVDAFDHRVTRLPLRVDFERDPAPFVHSWVHGTLSELVVGQPPEPLAPGSGRALAWRTEVQDYHEDMVFLAFDEGVPPLSHLRLAVRSQNFTAYLRIEAETEAGVFTTPAIQVPADRWLRLDVMPDDFYTMARDFPRFSKGPLAVRRLRFYDVTDQLSGDRGPNTLWVDELVME